MTTLSVEISPEAMSLIEEHPDGSFDLPFTHLELRERDSLLAVTRRVRHIDVLGHHTKGAWEGPAIRLWLTPVGEGGPSGSSN